MKPGDRVIVRGAGGNRRFLNGMYGTVLEKQPHQFSDELSVQIDGYDSFHYLLAEDLEPWVESRVPPSSLPVDSAARKDIPVTTGVFDYFPAAIAYVARVSKAGNDKHNPGEPLHWARGKSMDQADTIGRHLLERGGIDPEDGLRHSGKLAWRALALLQLELEEAGEAPLARGASA